MGITYLFVTVSTFAVAAMHDFHGRNIYEYDPYLNMIEFEYVIYDR